MNISAEKHNFDIYDLFCHDNPAADVRPFSHYDVESKLNFMAEEFFPRVFVRFVSPDTTGNTSWVVHFGIDRYAFEDSGRTKSEVFPVLRVYTKEDMIRSIPPELVEILDYINRSEIFL